MGTIFFQDVLHNARAETLRRGINWFKFNARKAERLRYAKDAFDITHTHQALQHVNNLFPRHSERCGKLGEVAAS